MWQHTVNVIFGAAIVIITFLLRDTINALLGWVLISAGAIIAIAAIWGWIDEMSRYRMLDSGM